MKRPLGNRFSVIELSKEYGERRFAVDDAALTRESLVREWRQRGPGRTSVRGIRPPKTGLIWRGTRNEAEQLCEALNMSSGLGTMTVASDPPTRENAVAHAKARHRANPKPVKRASFFRCDSCGKMVKEGHKCNG